jgi:protocatechuate 3,4-dioxygenase beta subunit
MPNSKFTRRRLIGVSVAIAGNSWFIGSTRSAGATLQPTPAQTAGPFYPVTFPPDSDNDLIHVAGHSGSARGTAARITGRVLDRDGRPVSGARVEIWQCDANGRYHYVRDDRADRPRDDNFQGYGTATADPSGVYQFLTIKPVAYPGRTPHIHFAVSGRGFERFVTQMYVAGEPENAIDPVLTGVRDPVLRDRLIVALNPAHDANPAVLKGEFDIVLR